MIPVGRAAPPADTHRAAIGAEVLRAAERELARLASLAEQEKGPEHPPPSTQLAFMLLDGLAAQSVREREPTGELRKMGVELSKGEAVQLFIVAGDARIVRVAGRPVQDKAGYWHRRQAILLRRQGDRWVERGTGSIAIDGVPQPE